MSPFHFAETSAEFCSSDGAPCLPALRLRKQRNGRAQKGTLNHWPSWFGLFWPNMSVVEDGTPSKGERNMRYDLLMNWAGIVFNVLVVIGPWDFS